MTNMNTPILYAEGNFTVDSGMLLEQETLPDTVWYLKLSYIDEKGSIIFVNSITKDSKLKKFITKNIRINDKVFIKGNIWLSDDENQFSCIHINHIEKVDIDVEKVNDKTPILNAS